MSRTYKDKKERKHAVALKNNGPASFKVEERRRRRAQAKDCMRTDREPDKTYIYSDYYW